MKHILSTLILITITLGLHAQKVDWYSYINTPAASSRFQNSTSDEDGNIYIISKLASNNIIVGGVSKVVNGKTGWNYLVTKIDTNGNNIWNRVITHLDKNHPVSIYADKDQVYVVNEVEVADSLKVIVPKNASKDDTIQTSKIGYWYSIVVVTLNSNDGYYAWHKSIHGEHLYQNDIAINDDHIFFSLFETIHLKYVLDKDGTNSDRGFGGHANSFGTITLNNSSSIFTFPENSYDQRIVRKSGYSGNLMADYNVGSSFLNCLEWDIDNNNNLYLMLRASGNGVLEGKNVVSGDQYMIKLDSNLNFQWMLEIKVTKNNKNDALYFDVKTIGDLVYLNIKADNAKVSIDNKFTQMGSKFLASISPQGEVLSMLPISGLSGFTLSKGRNDKLYFYAYAGNSAIINNSTVNFSTGTNFIVGEISSQYNTITGNIFLDFDKDGIMNNQDVPAKNIVVKANGTMNFTNADGKYYISTSDSGNNKIEPVTKTYFNPNPASKTVVFNGYFNHDSADFALQPTINIDDLEIHLTNKNNARAGRTVVYQLTARNVGTTVLSPDIILTYDSLLHYVYAVPIIKNHVGNKIYWGLTDLVPFDTKNITITFNADTTLKLGDSLCNFVSITATNDTTPENNVDTLYQEVRASYDPNIKETSRPEIIDVTAVNGSFPIDYTIHFQNTGNDTAFHIYLIDSLDADLKVESIEVLSASHDYEMSISENNTLRWDYYNILLVDSNTNEPESHGFVKYRVWTKDNPKRGDEFTNFADIYFDFNEPVRTNTTVNRIDFLESVRVFKNATNLTVYPNPSNGVFTVKAAIKAGTNAKIEVMDLTGKLVSTQTAVADAHGLQAQIDINTLPQGIYFVKVYANDEVYTAKVVKQ